MPVRSLHISYPLNTFILLPIMKTDVPTCLLVQEEKVREEKVRVFANRQFRPSIYIPPPHSLDEQATKVKEDRVTV